MMDDTELEVLLGQSRTDSPGPDLMARVLSDADVVQAELAREPARIPVPKAPWWSVAVRAIGGWSAVSAITAAGVVGLAVGLYSPDTITSLTGTETAGSYELAPDLSGLWMEDGDV